MKRVHLAAIAVGVLLVAIVVALVVIGWDREQPQAAPSPSPSASSPSPEPERELVEGELGTPERIEITSLDVDAPVQSVGTTPENAQQVPSALDETGWWRDGAIPGAPGNAVIVGHTASSDDGVFDPLVDIESGDDILITGEKGTGAFSVTEVDVVPVEDFAGVAPDVYRAEGPSGIVLMTCGDWNGAEFETTVIVFAEPA